MHHDEQWQLFARNGLALSGKSLPSESPHDSEHSFGLAIVWLWRIYNGIAEICVQRRSMSKKRWPGMYSSSAGGHINADELPQQAALRETREEIGIDLDLDKLYCMGTFRIKTEPQNLRYMFSYQIEGEPDFRFDDGEVASMTWMSLVEFERQLLDPTSDMVMARYGQAYASLILEELHRQVTQAVS